MRLLTYSLTQLSDLGLKKNTTRFLLPLPMILASLAWKFDWRALQSNNNASETRMPVPSRTSTSARKQSHFMSNQRELFRTEIAHQKLSMEGWELQFHSVSGPCPPNSGVWSHNFPHFACFWTL